MFCLLFLLLGCLLFISTGTGGRIRISRVQRHSVGLLCGRLFHLMTQKFVPTKLSIVSVQPNNILLSYCSHTSKSVSPLLTSKFHFCRIKEIYVHGILFLYLFLIKIQSAQQI